MRTAILACATLCLLAACTTPEQRRAYMLAEVESMVQVYGPACDRLGYARDTDPWRNCIVQLSVRDELARASSYNGYYGRPWWY